MPAKVDTYLDLAREIAQGLAGSVGAWTAFLDTASRLYKYPFHDQLMIHAQRPEATACASYEVWNDTMRRYVRRGAKGIALVDNSGDAPRLRYVFDIADTGTRRSSRPFSPWEINDGNLAEVQLGLRQAFNAEGDWLSSQLQDVARDLAEMYFDAHRHDIAGIIDGSLMAGYDEGELRDSFTKAAYASTAYALLSRCGYDPAAYFDEADFAFISEWNTSEAVTALGTAVSENAQMVLRQIERTIRSYERSQNHDRDNLYDRERRPTAEPHPARDRASRPLREDAPEVSAGAPANTVEPAPVERNAVAAPARDGGSGAAADRPDAAEAGGGSGRDGGTESSRPDEVDGAHEQLQGSGRRSSSERIDLQLNFFDEAEDAQAPSAFSFPQEVMDDVLRLGGNTEELRMRVAAEFEKRRSIDEIAAFLPTVYQGGNGFIIDGEKYAVWFSEDGIRVAHGEQARYERGAQLITWADAAARIGELLGDGRFATKEEVTGAEDYEHELIARKLRDLQHDLSKGNEGLFPSLADVDGGYPEAVQKIAAKLADPEGREAVLGDYLAFREAYKADRGVLRFHSHDVDGIFVLLAAQLLERRKFKSDIERVPEVNSFITQDEIGDALSHGGGVAGSKWRILRHFTEEHSLSEKAAVLKDLYGIGGRSHALSGATGSGENHDAKGIRLSKPGCEDVNLTWSAVARRIDELIASDRYMTEAELAEYDLHTAAYAKYRDVKASNSDAIVLVAHGGSYYAYGPDCEQVSRTLGLREQRAGGLDYVVIPGEQLDEALEKLRSRSVVVYVDEAGVEHTLSFIISDAEREQYEKQLVEALVNDSAYVNAVRNSDSQNARDEGYAAIRRIAAESTDMRFLKLYHDNAEFRNGLRNDVLAAAYKEVSERPAVLQPREPSASAYGVGDFVWLDGQEFKITDLQRGYVELLPPELPYPIYRTERRADFERMLRRDERNRHITDRLSAEHMSRLCGKNEVEIAAELSGVIFRVPGTERYVTADEYLSGNVRVKLREAEAAAKDDASYSINVEALKAAQPRELTASEIGVRLGATWIEPRYIEQFMVETFQPTYWASRSMSVNYSPYTSEWHIYGKNAVGANDVNAFSTYGTSRMNAYKILENTLNLRDVRIYDKIEDADGTERRVLNVKETTLAQQKQQVIKDAFRDWLWKDPKRRETLVAKYNELFNSTRPRDYDGSHLTFPGINPEIELREHQRNAIARILYGGNTLLAHEVGAGKTFTMAAAAMEAKRLGLCRKPMFAVPNHLTEQWASEFLRLYPSANVLVATKKDFEPANRKKFCARIATGDYDAVIIGHSQFERIPVSQERQERLLRSEIEDITEGINQLKRSSGERFSIKSMEKTKKSLEAKLKKLLDSPKDDVVTFEELGVDRLFVDEAHSHKNLYYHTKMQNVAGLSSAEAQKSSDMYMKCRYMDELTGSRGIVFATGTPVSNSMTELYTMQRYLQHDTLDCLGLGHFDSWAANFGETVTALELAPEGTGYRARTRFSKFFNLPELMNLFREVADIKTADQLNLPTPEVVYHNEVSQPTEIQKKLVQELSERATKVHARMVDSSEDNMLAITNDGRKLGLDQRVVNPLLPDADGTKVNRCVDNVFRIWQDGAGEKLTQLIFCDLSTPGKGFNVYDDIKKKLADRGVPESEIAFIHTADTEAKKKELFAKVRSGNVRVLLGSTAKMGAGTNVQDRLIALHDLDAPWRPGDLEQRKGRIARQGNMNETVHVYRYVTEQTFDSYIWQTLENKQRFISQIMTSKSPVRSCEDADETTLSYAEVKALCAGDPRIRKKMDLDVQVAKLRLLKSSHQSQKYQLEDRLLQYFPREIAATKAAISGCEADVATRDAHPAPVDSFAGIELQGLHYDERIAAGEALLNILPTVQDTQPVHVGSFRGFDVEVSLEQFGKHVLTLKGTLEHHVELGADARGNISRIENTLTALDKKLGALNTRLSDLERQVENARKELEKPFPQEDELRKKSARLVELNAELDMENNAEPQEAEKPSVLAKLKEPIPLYEPKNAPSKEACR